MSAVRTAVRSRGFTLIETMLTLGIFSIGMLGIVAYQAKTANGTAQAANLAIASYVAHTLADSLSIMPPTLLATGTTVASFDHTGTPLVNNSDAAVGVTFHATTQLGAADALNLRDANVIVRWSNPGSPTSSQTTFSTKVMTP